VRTLVNESQSATAHQVVWDGRNERGEEMPAGLYVYRIEAGTFTQSQKMVLLK
jgi:flagellar hook assembly protein FlgD